MTKNTWKILFIFAIINLTIIFALSFNHIIIHNNARGIVMSNYDDLSKVVNDISQFYPKDGSIYLDSEDDGIIVEHRLNPYDKASTIEKTMDKGAFQGEELKRNRLWDKQQEIINATLFLGAIERKQHI